MRREGATEARLAGDLAALELLESMAGEDGRLPRGWSKDARAAVASKRLRRRADAGDLPEGLLDRLKALGACERAPTPREVDERRVGLVEAAAGEGGLLGRGWSRSLQALDAARALRRSCLEGRLDADLEARLRAVGFDARRHGVRRAVECVETGEVFPSASAAARALGRERPSAINNCLRGAAKTAYGLRWRYAEGEERGEGAGDGGDP